MTPMVKREDQLQSKHLAIVDAAMDMDNKWRNHTALASSLWIAGGVLALAGGGGSDYHVCKVVEPARRLACLPVCLTGAASWRSIAFCNQKSDAMTKEAIVFPQVKSEYRL